DVECPPPRLPLLLLQDADRAGEDGAAGTPRRAGAEARPRARRLGPRRPPARAPLLRGAAEAIASATGRESRRPHRCGSAGGRFRLRYYAAARGAVAQLVRALHS